MPSHAEKFRNYMHLASLGERKKRRDYYLPGVRRQSEKSCWGGGWMRGVTLRAEGFIAPFARPQRFSRNPLLRPIMYNCRNMCVFPTCARTLLFLCLWCGQATDLWRKVRGKIQAPLVVVANARYALWREKERCVCFVLQRAYTPMFAPLSGQGQSGGH